MPAQIALTSLTEVLADLVVDVQGDGPREFRLVSSPEKGGADSLVFCQSEQDFSTAQARGVRTFGIPQKLAPAVLKRASDCTVLSLRNPTLAFCRTLQHFFPEKVELCPELRPPTSFVHPTAHLHESVRLSPGTVIGARVQIGRGTFVGANTVIENDVIIGEDCDLQSLVFIGQRTLIGNRVRVKPQSTVGAEGFGFAQDNRGQSHRIPQKGRVVLEDDVEVGASCTIDRATLDETRIGQGTKLDNQIHIAHNCKIGKHSLFAGGFMTAGSSTFGDFVMTGGRVNVTDHIQIGDKVQIAGTTSVSKDIPGPGAFGGYPTQPVKEFLKTTASLPHLPKLRKDVAKILRHLNLDDLENIEEQDNK